MAKVQSSPTATLEQPTQENLKPYVLLLTVFMTSDKSLSPKAKLLLLEKTLDLGPSNSNPL